MLRSARPESTGAFGLQGGLCEADARRVSDLIADTLAEALRRRIPLRRINAEIPRAQIASLAEQAGQRPACQRGCAACCHQPVAASPVEVLDLAAYLRATRSAADLQSLRAALAAQGTAATARCALLGPDNVCSVYPRRPLACVRYHSMDAMSCAALDGTHVFYGAQEQLGLAIEAGLLRGCGVAGLESSVLRLDRALSRALSDPSIESRWLRGERVFAGTEEEGQERPARAAVRRRHLPVVRVADTGRAPKGGADAA